MKLISFKTTQIISDLSFPQLPISDNSIFICIIECVDETFDYYIGFSDFMKQGRDLRMPAIQKHIEDTASFDLTILSLKGYIMLQYDLEEITGNIFDGLYMTIEGEE